MPTNLFGPASKDDIKVGYISTDTGYVTGVTICEANNYAQKNPGTTFIFRNGNNNIQYLNINEVNKLTPNDIVSTANTCGGPQAVVECGVPVISITGGGGVGALGNAVVGSDGAILAVDVIEGGFGYQYEPFVNAKDNCQIGNGAVLTAVLGESTETLETYDNEADFEEYEICPDTTVGYGRNWGPNGEDLGPWDPKTYTEVSEDPIQKEIEKYQKEVTVGKNPFWTTRKNTPKRVTSLGQPFRKYDVTDASHLKLVRESTKNKTYTAWNEFMNSYAVSPVSPSNVSGSDYAGRVFTFEWEDSFPRDGEYIFRGLCDNKATLYVDGLKLFDLGGFNQAVNPQRKTLQAGVHKIRVDLLNNPIYETKIIQDKVETQVAGADFILKSDGYYLLVGGNVETEVTLSLSWKDDPNSYGIAISKAIIPNPDGEPIILEKNKENGNWATRGSVSAKSIFKVNREYGPITLVDTQRTPRLANKNTFYGESSTRYGKIEFFDGGGDDVNGYIQIIETKNLQPNRIISQPTSSAIQNRVVFNTVDYIDKANRPLWRTNVFGRGGFINDYGVCPFDTTVTLNDNPYAGTHTIVWSNVNFPVDGSYRIRMGVDDNVTLYIGDEQIRYEGFIPGTSISKPEFNEIRTFKAGNYTIRAELEQIPGGQFGFDPTRLLNPMVLAIDIGISYASEQVVTSKSWNENPMAISVTIDAPPPIIPQEKPPVQTGRCPPSPLWSTRFPGASNSWYPVRFNGWSKFLNRYALSPVPPLDTLDSDSGGSIFRNSWNIEIPYRGYYKLQGEVDDIAKIYIDDKLSLNLSRRVGKTNGSEKVLLEKGNHTISVEVTNYTSEAFTQVEKKIFSTHDWEVAPVITQKQEQKAGSLFIKEGNQYYMLAGGNDIVEIDLVLDWKDDPRTAGLAVKKLIIDTEKGPLIFDKAPGVTISGRQRGLRISGGTIPTTGSIAKTGTFKANKKYAITIEGRAEGSLDPVIVDTGSNPDQKQQRINLFDGDGNDVNGKFTATNARQLSPARESQTLTPILEKNGVTYSGPQLASYRSGFISPAYFDGTGQEVMDKNWTMKWTNVDFPEDGQYIIKAEADDEVIVRIDGVEAGRAKVFQGMRTSFINVTKGKRTVELQLYNIAGNAQSTFEDNPVVAAVEITKNVTVSTGHSKPWTENPIGVSAILVPPPCPKLIRGRGVVDKVIVEDPGVGYISPAPTGQGYPVILKLAEVIVENPGINYNCGVDQLQITPDTGCQLSYTCDSFGRIKDVKVNGGCSGFTFYPEITLPSETGVNASFRPVFEVIRDPLTVDDGKKLIQVTDLVGLKQTGYVDGRAYYGAVFYENGVKYAGYYKTVGTPTRVYNTLQESITAKVTTPASAIERSGTDVTSNDPRLNIPGTPNTTT